MSEEMIAPVAEAIEHELYRLLGIIDFDATLVARAAIAAYNPNERLTTVTDAMLCAGGSAVVKTAHLTGCERARIIYAAMIEAAPRNPNERLREAYEQGVEDGISWHCYPESGPKPNWAALSPLPQGEDT